MSTMGYVSTLEGAAASASLSLEFEKQSYRIMEGGKQVNKGFDELFTFSRATTGGRFNEKGLYETVPANQPRFDYDPITKALKGLLVEEQRTNLVIYSDNLAALSNVRSTTLRNAALAPDGTYTAAKLVNDSVADWHFIRTNLILASVDGILSASVFAKAGEYPRVRLASGDNTVFSRSAVFDLETGAVVQGGSNGSMTSVGNGWWRCTLSLLGLKVGNAPFTIGAAKAGELDTNTAGNGGGLYLWGAQGENGAFPTSHISTGATFTSRSTTATYFDKNGVLRTAGVNVARTGAYLYDQSGTLVPAGLILESASTNLLKLTKDLSISPWVRTTASVSVTEGGVAPDGSVAQMFTMYGATGHNINQTLSTALTVGTTYTLSVWLRSPNWGNKQFQLAYYDGGVVQVGSGGNATPTAEWKRYEYTFTPSTVAASPQIRFIGYGNGVDGDKVEIFGPQLEVGSTATSYIPSAGSFTGRASTATYLDSQGLLQTAAVGIARSNTYKYDVNGVLRPAGLLLENSSTNRITNSTGVGGAWSSIETRPGSILVTQNASVAPDGTSTATKIEYPEKVPVNALLRRFPLTGQPDGSTFSASIWIRSDEPTDIWLRGTVGGNIPVTTKWTRVLLPSFTNTGTTFNFDIGPAGSSSTPAAARTVYIWGAQFETGVHTSTIVTDGTVATRAADVFNVPTGTRAADISSSVATTRDAETPSVPVGSWYNQAGGTLVVDAVQGLVGTKVAHFAHLAGELSYYGVRVFNSTVATAAVVRDTTDVNLLLTGHMDDRRRAVRVKAGDYAFSSGGSDVVKSSSAQVVTPTRLEIGSGTGFKLNGHVKGVTYYPVALTDSQLQLISA